MEPEVDEPLGDVGLVHAGLPLQGPQVEVVRASQADNRVLMSLFPSVEPVPLRDGLTDTLAWFKERS